MVLVVHLYIVALHVGYLFAHSLLMYFLQGFDDPDFMRTMNPIVSHP